MRIKLFLCFIAIIPIWVNAQIESTTSLRIDSESDLNTNDYSLSGELSTSESKSNFGLYEVPEHLEDYARNKKPFSMENDNGFLKPTADGTPKWFKTEKEIKDEYLVDQFLGNFKSGAKFVMLLYRDHGSIDGDLVRIFLNNDVIRGNAYLSGSFKSIKINLVKGFNTIDIQALNEGEASPNTAEFQLYDDQGNLITSNEWNLATGVRASFTVIKE
ncbi:hypothetical protein U6A24_13730 [Aquimarina gracilis]|uniref:Secreted protein n=1 Tax=Aquimarina gracilis TaxID=874422 RepID=A0ABU5ZXF0_9FLAO|nr:hypothetical protein [Aquimarina gracilis]MEB3346533.1 hypothetical protein [Aquimarina gracilis]